MSTKGYTELNLESSVPMAGRPKKYTAEKGANDRLSLVWWNVGDDGILDLSGASPKFVSAARNYIPGVGYILNKGPEYTKVAGEAPRTYIATIVARWLWTNALSSRLLQSRSCVTVWKSCLGFSHLISLRL